MSGSAKRRFGLGILVLLAIVFLYPFETTLVPEWKVRIVDESGAVVAGVAVKEGWIHNSVERNRHEQTLTTDSEGYVAFPSRALRANLLLRLAGPAVVSVIPHAQRGPHVFLDVLGPYSSRSSTDYSPKDPLPNTIIVRHL